MSFLDDGNKEKCCGCRGCEQICGHFAIKMIEDNEGFLYPSIDLDKCINCGLCKKVCPIENKELDESKKTLKVYAAWNKKQDILKQSSSGGVFTSLCEYILNLNGNIYGVEMAKDIKVQHICVNDKSEIYKFRDSKYVQSDVKNTFKLVKKDLLENKKVLYSGTPCQIAGLKEFLGTNFANSENLYLVDIICHGVPSPKFFKKYIKSLEKKISGEILNFKFRKKTKGDWVLAVSYKKNGKKKEKNIIPMMSPYYFGFMNNMLHRPICYKCPYANVNREGDITIGDYWGVKKFHPKIKTKKGVSLVILNNKKGINIFEKIKNELNVEESLLEYAKEFNKNLSKPSNKNSVRDIIYKECEKKGFEEVADKYLTPQNKLITIIKHRFPVELKDKLRKS